MQTQPVRPEDFLEVAALASSKLREVEADLQKLKAMAEAIEIGADDFDYDLHINELIDNGGDLLWIVARLEEMKSAVLEDIYSGIISYNPKEPSEVEAINIAQPIDDDFGF